MRCGNVAGENANGVFRITENSCSSRNSGGGGGDERKSERVLSDGGGAINKQGEMTRGEKIDPTAREGGRGIVEGGRLARRRHSPSWMRQRRRLFLDVLMLAR